MPNPHRQRSPAPTVRQRRVNALLQQQLAAIITRRDFSGLRGMVTITAVKTTPDLRQAKVWISIFGQAPAPALGVLQRHRHEIQSDLYQALSMRPVPKIEFSLDTAEEFAFHIDQVIKSLKHD